ncbi:MAG: NADH-quinone oxidoreductase subunit M [Planctomycetota bacterium]|jgi:NADH-quinone oxidoreductase subunit M|nr:MAG: NADH-quinone oxidoreductase subunit M [Planctomycetota bacterium]
MNGFPPGTHLLLVIATPLVGGIVAWVLGARGRHAVRQSAAVTAIFTLAGAGWLIVRSLQSPEAASGEPYAVIEVPWLVDGIFDVRLSLGLDGLSLWLFGLSALLSLTAVLVSWEAIKERTVGFYVLLLVLEAAMLGVFAARDVILFYVFFEFTLVPLFFLIGIWGHEERRKAAVKFFLYTLAGSVLAFLGLLTIVLWHASHAGTVTFDIDTLTAGMAAHPLPMNAEGGWLQMVVFLALFAGFAVKVPIVPFHTWLPLAHVEAPTGGSVDLAGVLLKIGIYGFLRFSLPMLPDATAVAAPWLFGLGVVGILYGALVALVQTDLKRLIAYSSVSHMGYCVMGLFALEAVSVEGATLQLINHGLSSAGLFALVGMIYERFHTRSIPNLGGIAARAPWLTVFFMLFTFSSIGLPGLNGFVGEFMVLAGSFQRAWSGVSTAYGPAYLTMSVAAVVGVVLGAWYMLWAVERVFFGGSREPPKSASQHSHGAGRPDDHGHDADAPPDDACDLKWYETLALVPLVVFVFWIGVVPATFLEPSATAVRKSFRASAEAFDLRMHMDVSEHRTLNPSTPHARNTKASVVHLP